MLGHGQICLGRPADMPYSDPTPTSAETVKLLREPALIRAATAAGMLFALLIVVLYSHQDYVETVARNQQRATLLASVVEAYSGRVFKETEAAMQSAALISGLEKSDAASSGAFYKIQHNRAPHLKALLVETDNGNYIGGAEDGYRAALQAWANEQDGASQRLFVGNLMNIDAAGARVPFLPMRLTLAEPRRTVLAAIGADLLLPLHKAAGYGPDTLSVLLSADGQKIVARAPYLQKAIGLDVSNAPLYETPPAGPPSGIRYGPTPADGVERVMAYRQMPDYNVRAYGGIERDGAMQPWYDRLKRSIAAFIGVAAVLLLLARYAWHRVDSEVATRRALRDKDAEIRSTLRSLAEGVVVQDTSGQILGWNPAALTILGLTAEQISGRTSFDPAWRAVDTHGAELPGDQHPAIIALATGEAQHHFIMGIDSVGRTRRWLSVNSIPIIIDGKVVRAVTSFSDITIEMDREQDLRELNHELEARVARRTEALENTGRNLQASLVALEARALAQQRLIYILSHDLREPLNGIINFTRVLTETEQEALSAPGKKYFSFISASAVRMKVLLDDLLKYVRLEAGDVTPVEINLAALLEEIRVDVHDAIEKNGAVLVVKAPVKFTGDISLIRILLQNLITNAIKFVPSGRVPHVSVTATSTDDSCVISVHDNGIGIPADKLDRVFDLFARLHQRTKFEGTGLGLSICRRIVEIHHGTIVVTSDLNLGSTFTVTLPLHFAVSERSI
jgi:PAS domain S-box-containing protein